MYKSIQVKDFNFARFPRITYQEVNDYKAKNKDKLINIQKYLMNKENILSVDRIANHLFLDVKADIFLSHSHKDEDDVIRLAILIERKLGLTVFIDSCVWGNAYELLAALDYEYCIEATGKTFDYHKRNHTTANVFMILNAALHRIIDNCEAFIFLGTDNSISITDAIDKEKYISSPWIYSELQFAALVERKKPRNIAFESRDNTFADSIAKDEKPVQFAFTVPNTDATLSNQKLLEWLQNANRPSTNSFYHPLDDLYTAMTTRKHNLSIKHEVY